MPSISYCFSVTLCVNFCLFILLILYTVADSVVSIQSIALTGKKFSISGVAPKPKPVCLTSHIFKTHESICRTFDRKNSVNGRV